MAVLLKCDFCGITAVMAKPTLTSYFFFISFFSPVAFKGVLQWQHPGFVTPSNVANWEVAGRTGQKCFPSKDKQCERARPLDSNPAAIQRIFMSSREQNQDQRARECSNKQKETRPCFHKKHKLGAIFIKNNVLSFQLLTVRAASPAKQLHLVFFHSLLRTLERFAAIMTEA